MNKEVKFQLDARSGIKKGMDILGKAVASTLGPNGQCVIIGNYTGHQPHITKDGVTVAKNIHLKDNFADTGVCLLREASLKTVSAVGDSTTTSTVLAKAFIDSASELIESGYNPIMLKNSLQHNISLVLDYIKSKSRTIKDNKDIEHVATISANNDPEIGKLIATAFTTVGNDGIILVEESRNTETTIDVITGMQFEKGYESPIFVTDEIKNNCVLDNPYIFLTEQKVLYMRDLVPILEIVAEENRPILLIAEHFDPEVIENLKMNKLQGILKICAVKAPSFGEYRKMFLEDIGILTGATCLTYESGLSIHNMDVSYLGTCEKVVIDKNTTTIVGGKTSKEIIQKRVDSIKEQIKDVGPENEYLIDFHKGRIARLIGGICTIHVGGTTEMEMRERKDRVDDAVCATKSAIEEGIVPGGGLTYLGAAELLKTQSNFGVEILIEGLTSVFETLIVNGGKDHFDYFDKLDFEKNIGIDVRTYQPVDMFEAGIVNPTKAERIAFENAISVLNLYLSTNCVIVDEPINY